MCLREIVNGVKLRFVNWTCQAGRLQSSSKIGESKRRIRVLIVDDEPGVAMTMRFILGRANCEAQIAGTREKAIKMAESGNYDLITLDVNLRGANGFDLCAELKANPLLRETPMVMVSGLCSLEDQQRGLDVGAVDYITKPFNAAELVPRLLSHIKPTLTHA